MESVWPLLTRCLDSLSVSCVTEYRSNPTYTHTVDYKLQKKLLESVGDLCVRVSVMSDVCVCVCLCVCVCVCVCV